MHVTTNSTVSTDHASAQTKVPQEVCSLQIDLQFGQCCLKSCQFRVGWLADEHVLLPQQRHHMHEHSLQFLWSAVLCLHFYTATYLDYSIANPAHSLACSVHVTCGLLKSKL